MKSLTAEITAHLNRKYEYFIQTDTNWYDSYRMSHTVWLKPVTVGLDKVPIYPI